MPKVSTFASGVTIHIYYQDHAPPHFHAIKNDDEMLVEIANSTVVEGTIPGKHRKEVLKWCVARKRELQVNWDKAVMGLALDQIPPPE